LYLFSIFFKKIGKEVQNLLDIKQLKKIEKERNDVDIGHSSTR